MYCAAGLAEPVEQIIDQYRRETGQEVQVIYNGSGALLSQLRISQGDLYLPANKSYLEDLNSLGLSSSHTLFLSLTAVIVVAHDDARISTLSDLTDSSIRLSLAIPSAGITRHTIPLLQEMGYWQALSNNTIVSRPTVNSVIEDVALASADAGIAWQATAQNNKHVKLLGVPLFSANPSNTGVAVLRGSKIPSRAQHFADYLSAADKGVAIFQQHGYQSITP